MKQTTQRRDQKLSGLPDVTPNKAIADNSTQQSGRVNTTPLYEQTKNRGRGRPRKDNESQNSRPPQVSEFSPVLKNEG